MGRHSGKTAIVTGAAQGLGRAVASRLAAEGASVMVVDRSADLCQAIVADIQADGGTVRAFAANLETYEGNAAMVGQVLDYAGSIDIAVFNVGGTIWAQPLWEYQPQQIEQELARSLWPTVWGCYAVLPNMLERGRGAIVNIGTAATRWSLRVPYAAAKGGVHALTAALSRDLADTEVRVNCVSPGALAVQDRITPRNSTAQSDRQRAWRDEAYQQSVRDTPLGRPGTPEEVVGAVSFLASDEASYITGQTLFVAGGAIG
ncbi:SDR family oxidoreductase [Pigmentiphaga sp. GD03639]|uniref:SDR family NAD(P)-dependent oxidoreductase n=1 Tax=Pigmentiphaga sp. GD03639 TaxID=2975354 RepID=UPI00244B435F|nr:SDR family oxidoreductase [Pigmentiphaga sp. GD03639]MDH2235041.1 SDR family oxidoreductase [Pigmentiphaga sp. GD03639]